MPVTGYKLKNAFVSFWHLYEWNKTNMIILTKKMHTDNKQIILHGAWYRINVL